MKLSTRPPMRRGARRAAWGAALVALACAVPVAVHATSAADAAQLAASRKTTGCPTTTDNGGNNGGNTPTPGNTTTPAPTPTPGNTTTPTPTPTPTPVLPISSIRITQANLKSGEATPKFLSDLSNVFSTCPDFVTYNEVPYRADDLLAPTGYDLFRTPGQYTGASPVVWRTDRWTAINRGTTMISNKRGRERGQHVEWGIRYANWVTVRSNDGKQMVSMVATHIAPKNSITAKLMGPSIQRLGALVGGLSSMGPVFVGGDFNVHYRAKDYPRAGLTAAGLTPSYDVYGSYLPTGDHHGATIDYVFMRPAASFDVLEQTTTELYSDHDALSVVLSVPATTSGETPVSFAPGTSVNDPTSTNSASRRSVARTVRAAVHNTPSGAAIRLSTAQLSDRAIAAQLRRAHRLGATVKIVSGSATPTRAEQALVDELGTRRSARSWIVFRPSKFRASTVPTSLLINRTGATTYLVLTANQPLTTAMARDLAAARMSTTSDTYATTLRAFGKLAKR